MTIGELTPASASRPPRTLSFACGHRRPALSGPSRTLQEKCRDCLSAEGTFKEPSFITFDFMAQIRREVRSPRARSFGA